MARTLPPPTFDRPERVTWTVEEINAFLDAMTSWELRWRGSRTAGSREPAILAGARGTGQSVGTSTASTTWMTPFVAGMFAIDRTMWGVVAPLVVVIAPEASTLND